MNTIYLIFNKNIMINDKCSIFICQLFNSFSKLSKSKFA